MEDLVSWRTVVIVVAALLVLIVARVVRRRRDEGPLKVHLFIALGNGHIGPIVLRIYQHHVPANILSSAMDEPLQIPQEMRTGKPRSLYSLRRQGFLKPDKPYREQHIEDDDVLLLTDSRDMTRAQLIAQTLADTNDIAVPPPREGPVRAVSRAVLSYLPVVGPTLAEQIFGPSPRQR
jgi:hypothetical protein